MARTGYPIRHDSRVLPRSCRGHTRRPRLEILLSTPAPTAYLRMSCCGGGRECLDRAWCGGGNTNHLWLEQFRAGRKDPDQAHPLAGRSVSPSRGCGVCPATWFRSGGLCVPAPGRLCARARRTRYVRFLSLSACAANARKWFPHVRWCRVRPGVGSSSVSCSEASA